MKKYQSPYLEESTLDIEDIITASGDGIVSSADQSAASETRESSWSDAWS